MTINQLVAQLTDEGYLTASQQPAIAALLTQRDHTASEQMPWYLRGLVGIGAWIAALLLLLFLSSAWWIAGPWSILGIGLAGCAAAVVLQKMARHNIFLAQLSLAVSLAGLVQVAFGVEDISNNLTTMWLALLVLEAALLLLSPDLVLRFFTTLGIAISLVGLLWEWHLPNGLHLLIIGLALGSALLWEREAQWTVAKQESLARPVGYGMTVALFGLLVVPFVDTGLINNWWISTAGLLGLLLAQVWGVLRHQGVDGRTPWAMALLAAVALLGFPALHTPGLLAALSITVLGIQRGNRVLTGLAIAFLALFLGQYYYNLDLTLLVKSLVLLVSGGALLGLRAGLLRFVPWPEEQP